jgi:hypothetical protein
VKILMCLLGGQKDPEKLYVGGVLGVLGEVCGLVYPLRVPRNVPK